MRLIGNVIAIVGGLIGIWAAYLWWKAATIPAAYNLDSITTDLQTIGEANKNAALWTGIAAALIAVAEIIRAFSGRRHH